MFEEMSFTLVDDNGKATECELLFTFENSETHKNYIVYTDNSKDENGQTKVFASIYDPSGEDTRLLPVETDEEWDMIASVLDELQEEALGKEYSEE